MKTPWIRHGNLGCVIALFCACSAGSVWAVKCVFTDPQFSFQTLRAVSAASGGGADVAECLRTAARIPEGDMEAWYREWYALGKRLEGVAGEFLAAGHSVPARGALLRACNYYRSAEFFLHLNPADPRILDSWGKSRACFQRAAALMDRPVITVAIPYEDTKIPGYLCLVDYSGAKRPLLMVHSGFDGTVEELYAQIAVFALERGYNCLLFEGPGQGAVIREQKLPFRPDWEKVVTPAVDFALERPEVDAERVALMGISFGGYLAPRAAAFEPRIKALIANGGVYDFHENFIRQAPPDVDEMLDTEEGAKEFDEGVYAAMSNNVTIAWVFGNGMWTFGVKTPSELTKATRPYTMKEVAGQIRCPTLIIDSENDKDMPGQARQLYAALECPKTFLMFTEEEAADEHCQIGAATISMARILNWLDQTFGR